MNLADIVRAIDGDQIFNGCGLGFQQCNAQNPCPCIIFLNKSEPIFKAYSKTQTYNS